MTGRNILDSALKLLGYTEANGNSQLPQRILNRGTSVINVIYSELSRAEGVTDFKPIKTLTDKIKLKENTLNEIMPAGVAMMIAGSEGDGAEQQLWAEIYNRKRSILTSIAEKEDIIPRSFDI